MFVVFEIITEGSSQKGREFFVRDNTIKKARKTAKELFPGEKLLCVYTIIEIFATEVEEDITNGKIECF